MISSNTDWSSRLKALSTKYVVPGPTESIWKEECAFSFTTPLDKDGLFLNLETYQAYSANYVGLDHDRTGNKLYLKIKYIEQKSAEPVPKSPHAPSKLAIGVDGGFEATAKPDALKIYGLVLYPNINDVLEYPSLAIDVPVNIVNVIAEVIKRDDASKVIQVQAWDASSEVRPISKFAENLVQVNNGKKISLDHTTWQCEESGLKENLWLNLSDGYIGSGRRNWDGTGGTGAALKHFEETGRKYPLCVKLGTITPDGNAEVYSYDPSEDTLVVDPYLEKHLLHFGLRMKDMKKTDKTLIEMEVDLNLKHVFSAITEDGKQLEPVYGSGFVGLINLGNSCYMNSSMQVLLSLQEFRAAYFMGMNTEMRRGRNDAYLKSPSEPEANIEVQIIKLGAALSDPYESGVQPDDDGVLAVCPRMLKDAIGKNHRDFCSTEQQDAVEYLRYILDTLSAGDSAHPAHLFKFIIEERLECMQTNQVKYKKVASYSLSLNIPMHKATNMPKVEAAQKKKKKTEEDTILPSVPFQACLEATIGDDESAVQTIPDYLSPATGIKGIAVQSVRLSSFPKYLIVQLKRYLVNEIDFTPTKLNCEVKVPLDLDLSRYRSTGKKQHEILLPEVEESVEEYDKFMHIATQLKEMGFDENLSRHAALKYSVVEQAMNWLLEHMDDAEYLNTPAELPVKRLSDDGEMEAERVVDSNDGAGKYKLHAFISHIGKSTGSGHYVCHIFDRTLNSWVLFNDQKVAKTSNPPLEHGYAYIYERL